MGRKPFRYSYLDWLVLVSERLEDLDCTAESDGPMQSSGFMLELRRLSRECQLMERTTHIQRSMGNVEALLQQRVRALLHDLHWLLQVSPAASPALARQCVRIAQDRVFDEVQRLAQTAVEIEEPRLAMM
ncbi:MAG: hypothetical protein ABI645_02060 [Pseudomonadota bacterium]